MGSGRINRSFALLVEFCRLFMCGTFFCVFWIWRVKHSTTSKPMFRPNCVHLVVILVPATGGQLPHPCKAKSPFRLGLSRRHVMKLRGYYYRQTLRSASTGYKRFFMCCWFNLDHRMRFPMLLHLPKSAPRRGKGLSARIPNAVDCFS